VLPAIVMGEAKVDLNERPPLGSPRFADEMHAGFLRGMIRLAGIARNAGAHDIFPGCRATPITGNNVIQVQILAVKHHAAVLAGILVALKNIVSCELDLFLGQAVEHHQKNHPWYPDPV